MSEPAAPGGPDVAAGVPIADVRAAVRLGLLNLPPRRRRYHGKWTPQA
jgi:hypothetical protein